MKKIVSAVLLLAFVCAGCAPGSDFQTMGASLLSSTGLVTGTQAAALFSAGGKLSKAASGLTEEQEYYLGRGVSALILSKYRPYRNAALNRYVNRVGMAVASHSDRPETFGGYHFLVLDSDEVNALAAPGGFIFVTRGFLRLLSSEDELAGVLAHEVGHVVEGHGVKAISQANLTEAFLILGKEAAASQGNMYVSELTSAFGDSINDVVETLLTKGYSRGQEYDADARAADIMVRAGYNPRALLTTFETLQSRSTGEESGWFETHPDPDDRHEELLDSDILPPEAGPSAAQSARTARFNRAVKGAV